MKRSMYILMDQIFDYAGLFPPAKLPLPTAFNNYLKYQEHPSYTFLGKFILPTSRCKEYIEIMEKSKKNIPLSILFSHASDVFEIYEILERDIQKIDLFIRDLNPKSELSSFEICLPLACYIWSKKKLFELFDALIEKISILQTKKNKFDIFCEIPFFNEPESEHFLGIIHEYNKSEKKIFIKLRTGGITPNSIPSIQNLSRVIYKLSQFLIPFKVTAGLHVPIPNYNPDVNAKMHGFLNVIFASMIAYLKKNLKISNIKTLENIIENFDYKHLNVQENLMILTIPNNPDSIIEFTNDALHEFRRYFKGIGTCSFLEPIEHLYTME